MINNMISLEEALSILNKYSLNKKYPITNVDIYDSQGMIIAEDIISNMDIPFYNRSNMDGYAVVDLNLKRYKIVNEIFAGDMRDLKIKENECVYVATGSKIPNNANFVIPVEMVDIINDKIIEPIEKTTEKYISKIGEDIKYGKKVLGKGEKLNERNIGLLASLGIEKIKVYNIPKIGIISTGSELSIINEVNSKTLYSIIKKANCIPAYIGNARDNTEDIENLINKAIELNCDIIITSGGVSEGKKDLIPNIVLNRGNILFHKVKMRPGKPMLFGEIDNIPIFGMPGNVVSCIVCSYVYLLPFLENITKMHTTKKIVKAKLGKTVYSEPDFVYYRPIKLENGIAQPTFKGSGLITSIAYADGFIKLNEGELQKNKNEIVDVWLFE